MLDAAGLVPPRAFLVFPSAMAARAGGARR